ncbi:MAG: lipoyl(octanoyl) transferase LipB [Gammaproteobacteria bacterium]|nr:lipoyl(octanoyl) transferase LipB [Gammaproteobacteria bacterium]
MQGAGGIVSEFNLYNLGKVDYLTGFKDQKRFIDLRQADTQDEIWCLEHHPVYTLGLSGKTEHILSDAGIPVVQSDRGGQVTYHGPGQLVVYPLLDLKRLKMTVKHYVHQLEQAIIDTLNHYNIAAHRISGAPGVYVDDKKVAALGIRIRRGYCYHGIAINIDMDLTPFNDINPCGFKDLKVTQLKDLGVDVKISDVVPVLANSMVNALGYESYLTQNNAQLADLKTMS